MAEHPDGQANPAGSDAARGRDEGAALPPVAPALRHAMANEAIRLGKLGLSPIALKGKKPISRYRKKPPSVRAVVQGVRSRGATGIGILLGDRSGGLVCRDFDEEDGFARWAAEHPDLARVLPRVRTRRGMHVYARIEGLDGCWKIEADAVGGRGELRAGGSYVVVPPSLHPSGHRYDWVFGLPALIADVPIVSAEVFGVNCEKAKRLGERATCDDGEDRKDSEVRKDRKDSNVVSDTFLSGNRASLGRLGPAMSVAEVLDACKLSGKGETDRMIHRLARALKFNAEVANPSAATQHVLTWFEANRSMMSDPDPDLVLDKFDRAFQTAKVPIDSDLLTQAMQIARQTLDDPDWPPSFRSPRTRLVLRAIRELTRLCGGHSAPISSYRLGELLAIDQPAAYRTIRLLEDSGWIRCTLRGLSDPSRRVASCYVYSPPAQAPPGSTSRQTD